MALSGAFDLQWEIHVCLNMKLDFVLCSRIRSLSIGL